MQDFTWLLGAATSTAAILGTAIWSMTKPTLPINVKSIDYNKMSKPLDEEGLIRTSWTNADNDDIYLYTNAYTCYDLFNLGLERGNQDCLGYKEDQKNKNYKYYSYAEIDEMAVHTGSGIISKLKQSAGQQTTITIFMRNCVEWVLVDLACTRYSMIPIPLFETLGEDALEYIINDTKTEVIFIDSKKKLEFLLRKKDTMPNLKYIIMNKLNSEVIKMAESKDVELLGFQDILASGQQFPAPLKKPSREDVFTLSYTSGTTGIPKGCVITHGMFVSCLSSAVPYLRLVNFGSQKEQEVHFSFLPLSHLYERLIQMMLLIFGGKIAFFGGEMSMLIDELVNVGPTIMTMVPRLMNRIYDKVMLNINSSVILKYLFHIGIESKSAEGERHIVRKNSIWDWLLFHKIQKRVGGRVRLIVVGSAPISAKTMKFFRATMGCIVVEGYGQTETIGPCTMTLPGDCDPDQVGVPIPGVTIKLEDVSELDLVASRDKRGEICVKGETTIREYLHAPELTKQLIDEDGWLHTGDVGTWTEKGQLKIVDRCKHIFKLSQGEYLAPERLENVYALSPLVSQIYVTGKSVEDYCVALVVPDIEGWNDKVKSNGRNEEFKSIRDICEYPNSLKILLEELQTVGRANRLMGYEIVKKVDFITEMMTQESGLITPTLKLKRAVANKFYADQVNALYS